ncbi:enoyl-hydratase isomerase family protein [Diplodia corticola]|uniref:Enoyl-hydratase isomerase family protein n=1 Tax=Diplodia corticola TaxID=236234 RepID=A0A1J9RNL3_9PEZI|nr:enoyl-hydratase isomerase family protein [Diplodia corticola]OJD29181.1 enoyl-hydratase isomerase family protein [Diplodia corticola]
MSAEEYKYEYFNVTFPREYVAHVEINRPEKLNAFVEHFPLQQSICTPAVKDKKNEIPLTTPTPLHTIRPNPQNRAVKRLPQEKRKSPHNLTTSPAPPRMWLNLSTIITRLSTSPNVRCILLTGAGPRAFTAGLDVQAASTSGVLATSQAPLDVQAASTSGVLATSQAPLDAARKALHNIHHITTFQACVSTLETCPKPTIAVLHGICYGLAIDLSLACDVRLCAADAAFAVKEVDIGIAADIGTLTRLPKAVGNASWAKDVALTARVFGADEALREGFVSGVYRGGKEEAVAAGLEKAALIASKSPVAVVGTKELLNYSRDHTVEEGLRYTAVWNGAMLQTDDIKDALMSGLKKTKPKFAKL